MTAWRDGGQGASARVWGVSALVHAISDSLAVRFSDCVVRGEISGFTRAASGHGYFTLKDAHGNASLRCAMFRRALSLVDFRPTEGMLVEARGNLGVYEARGELQLVVEELHQAGAGALFEQFLRLKAKLEAEGLFDASRKRPIPRIPLRVAVVTSLGAAALRDVLTALGRRAPHVEVVVFPCSVQGVEAPAQIVDAMASMAAAHRAGLPFDSVIVCRGGGSMEDLWSFNDERVVRAIVGCPVPVVCGVGHETDVTLADFAADLRAPTPTAAAELVAQDRAQWLQALEAAAQLMSHRVGARLDGLAQRLDQVAMQLSRPAQAVSRHRHELALAERRMHGACLRRISLARQSTSAQQARLCRAAPSRVNLAEQRLAGWAGRLEALSPQRVLERGYAWLSDDAGQPICSVTQASVGQGVQAVLADGRLGMTVSRKPDEEGIKGG